jgi:hypothetical protein
MMEIRQCREITAPWAIELVKQRCGGTEVMIDGEMINLLKTPALIAEPGAGLLAYRYFDQNAELLSFITASGDDEVGTALLRALISILAGKGIGRLWVTTTNDNVETLRYYQRLGFSIAGVRSHAGRRERLGQGDLSSADNVIPLRYNVDLYCDTKTVQRLAL